MTEQEIFNKVVRGLASQGFERSYGVFKVDAVIEAPGCMYRGPDGRKCAVGWLIPDSKYVNDMEGLSADNRIIAEAAGVEKDQRSFLAMLQRFHDSCDTPDDMISRFRGYAEGHGLKWPEDVS